MTEASPGTPKPTARAAPPEGPPERPAIVDDPFGYHRTIRCQQHGDAQSILGDQGVVAFHVDDLEFVTGPKHFPLHQGKRFLAKTASGAGEEIDHNLFQVTTLSGR